MRAVAVNLWRVVHYFGLEKLWQVEEKGEDQDGDDVTEEAAASRVRRIHGLKRTKLQKKVQF